MQMGYSHNNRNNLRIISISSRIKFTYSIFNNKIIKGYVNIYSSFGLTEAILWHSTLKEYEDIIVKGNQIAMYCKKDSDEKVIARKIKPYKQWVKDIQNQRKARSYYAIK